MKTRNGFQVYPLTVAQKFHLFYLPYCPNASSAQYWNKPDNRNRSGF